MKRPLPILFAGLMLASLVSTAFAAQRIVHFAHFTAHW